MLSTQISQDTSMYIFIFSYTNARKKDIVKLELSHVDVVNTFSVFSLNDVRY